MAGMRPFVLSGEIPSAYFRTLTAVGCPSSQIAVVKPSAVPLWKVIVGLRADKLQTGPARVRFFLVWNSGRDAALRPRREAWALARGPGPIYFTAVNQEL